MTSRERLLLTLDGKIPDRVPVSTHELLGRNSASFENTEPSYRTLMEFIRKYTDAVTLWEAQSNTQFAFSSYKADTSSENYDEDGYHVRKTLVRTPSGTLTQTDKWNDTIRTTWQIEHLCKDSADVDALMNLPFEPVQYDFSDYPRIAGEVGDHGIILYRNVTDPAGYAFSMMEFGEATVWALTETDHFKAVMDELHRRAMINLTNLLVCGKAVDMYRIVGAEYITPPFLPPKFFERFVLPYDAEMVSLIHSCGAKARIHSHGKIAQVFDMILETGADAIDPCESPPDGDIELAELKKRSAGRMTLFGNLQLKLLERGTADEVKQYVKKCMDEAKEGGRFVIMPTAAPISIPLSSSTEENYHVFKNTALEEGRY